MSSKAVAVERDPLVVRIVGSINLGSGYSLHTTYKLEVQTAGSGWVIYRRYASFSELHKGLLSRIGESLAKEVGVDFPEKQYTGSIGSTFASIVSSRMQGLQSWLDAALLHYRSEYASLFDTFVDIDNRGASGLTVQLGANKVIKEAFVKAKIVKNFFGVWATVFVVVLKNGNIVVLDSIYDNMSKVLITVCLVDGSVQVIPRASSNGIDMVNRTNGQKLKMCFASAAEAAFWIRTISDFSTNANYVPENVVAKKEEAKRASLKGGDSSAGTTENIRAEGTGNTVDELSALYGM